MRNIQVSSDIIPIAKFKSHASAVLEKIKTDHTPVVITENGEAAGVLICPEDFDRLTERDNFILSIEQGLHDAKSGNLISDDEFKKIIEAEFGETVV